MSVDIKTYQGNRKQALGAIRLFGDIADLVEQDERVLTGVAGLTIKVDSVNVEKHSEQSTKYIHSKILKNSN